MVRMVVARLRSRCAELYEPHFGKILFQRLNRKQQKYVFGRENNFSVIYDFGPCCLDYFGVRCYDPSICRYLRFEAAIHLISLRFLYFSFCYLDFSLFEQCKRLAEFQCVLNISACELIQPRGDDNLTRRRLMLSFILFGF